MKTAVFLDLQGTLGGDGLGDIRNFTFYPCAVPAIRLLNSHEIPAIVVTNQSHIHKGLLTMEIFEEKMSQLQLQLREQNAWLDDVYCCPHTAEEGCLCKKPNPYFLFQAAQKHGVDLSRCYTVGDMGMTDMVMARNAGTKAILVRTGVGKGSLTDFRHTWQQIEPDFIADDLFHAVRWILSGLDPDFQNHSVNDMK